MHVYIAFLYTEVTLTLGQTLGQTHFIIKMASVFKLLDVNVWGGGGRWGGRGGGEVRRNNLFTLLKWLTYGAFFF